MALTPQTNTTLAQLADIMARYDDFVICGHVSPDGDCIGSQLTLAHALRALGKRAACVLVKDEPPDTSLAFLPGIDELVPAAVYDGPCRVFVGVDVPSRDRAGEAACALLDAAETSVTIDHHAADVPMCEHVYVDPDAASASMLVWELVSLMMDEPPTACALCAYTGLMTDTGGFRFQNSDARAFDAAAKLVFAGADPALVASRVYQNRSRASLELEALVIQRLQVFGEGTAALSWVSQNDLKAVGAVKADVEPLVDTVRSLRGVRVACMLREQDGSVRGSLRAKDDTDVASLARELGGGGHKAAAGLTLKTTLPEAIELMRAKMAELIA